MKRIQVSAAIASVAATLVTCVSVAEPAAAVSVKLFGLTDSNNLISFSPNNPNQTRSVGISGIDGNLLGIDFRPANGLLYGVTDANKIYTIDPETGAATFVSTLSTAFASGFQSGVDFNPVPDRLRLVGSNDQNLRTNVDTGVVADFDPNTPGFQPDGTLAYAAGDTNAGTDPNITAAAYTNSFLGAPSLTRTTQLFGIDSALDVLVLQNPPNNGTLQTIGSLRIDFGSTGGFDIFSTKNRNVITNTAYAASGSTLYSIDLFSGEATTLGSIGSGNSNLVGLTSTAVPEPGTVAALMGLGGLGWFGSRRRKSVT